MSMDYTPLGVLQNAMVPESTETATPNMLSPHEDGPGINAIPEATPIFSENDLSAEAYESAYDSFLGFDASYFEL
jgi:hypothetical protein